MNKPFSISQFQVYTVDEQDIERHDLDPEDLGRSFIIVCGCIQFIESEG